MGKKSPKPTIATGYALNKMAGFYDGKELRPFDQRKGAMDAYKLPSMFQGKPFFRGQNK